MLEILEAAICMCLCQDKCLSIKTPRNLANWTCSREVWLILILAIATSYLNLGEQNTVKLVLVKLTDNRITRNHLLKSSSSQSAVEINLEKQLSDKKYLCHLRIKQDAKGWKH